MLGRPDVVQKAASYQNFSLPWSQIDLERDLVLVSYRFNHLIPILQAADYIFYCNGCALSQQLEVRVIMELKWYDSKVD
jgi:hypothetical protein